MLASGMNPSEIFRILTSINMEALTFLGTTKQLLWKSSVRKAGATTRTRLRDIWLGADQALCLPDGNHRRRGRLAAGSTQVPGQAWIGSNPRLLQGIPAHPIPMERPVPILWRQNHCLGQPKSRTDATTKPSMACCCHGEITRAAPKPPKPGGGEVTTVFGGLVRTPQPTLSQSAYCHAVDCRTPRTQTRPSSQSEGNTPHDRKPKGFKATLPGQCVGAGTIRNTT